VKPCRELRVESSLRSSSKSSLRDRWALVSLPFFIDFKSQFLYVLFLSCLELWCMHSYYHLVPLVCCYCSVGYLSDSRLLSLLIARVVYRRWCVSSYFIGWCGNIWLYSQMWHPGLNPLVKLRASHRSVIPVGVIVLLRLCNPPRRGHGELAKPGLLYPLVWIPCCDIVN
jgi:hypothetical protein